MKLSIIIPVYNEIETIKKLILKVVNQQIKDIQIIVVDDFSTDGTREVIKNDLSQYINKIVYHEKNMGKGAAIRSAQKFVSGDIVIIQDADLEYDPEDYKKLIDPIINKRTSIVYGSRVLNTKRYNSKNFISLYRIFFNHILTIFSNFVNRQNLTDAHTCYKVFDSKIFKNIKLSENDFAFCPEITSKISKLKLNIIEVGISYTGRSVKEGKKIGIIDGFRAILVLLKYGLLGIK